MNRASSHDRMASTVWLATPHFPLPCLWVRYSANRFLKPKLYIEIFWDLEIPFQRCIWKGNEMGRPARRPDSRLEACLIIITSHSIIDKMQMIIINHWLSVVLEKQATQVVSGHIPTTLRVINYKATTDHKIMCDWWKYISKIFGYTQW